MINEDKIKAIVNELIDLKNSPMPYEATDRETELRNHGIELAIIKLKVGVLGDWSIEEEKYELTESLLKTA